VIKKIIPDILLFSAMVVLVISCANPVSPEGGPKDTTPPKVLNCDPPNQSVHFSGSGIRIEFNEFISLKNPTSEIFISPPLSKTPDTRLRGKSLLLKIEDTLKANTTYSISFGDAITDLTEGNVLKEFTYVFSTGDYIDSLSLKGKVINAFTQKPESNVYVTLYVNNNDTLPFDSLPLKVAPYYLTKTDDNGAFTLGNLQQARFKLLAIEDMNSDLFFSQPSERIAFMDSLVDPYYIEIPKPIKVDSLKADSVPAIHEKKHKLSPGQIKKADSIRIADSVNAINKKYPSFTLRMFVEEDSIQRISKITTPREGMIVFIFKYPLKNGVFRPLDPDSILAPWLLEESGKRDSVTIWLTGKHPDTLKIQISDKGEVLDTAHIDLQPKPKSKKEEKETPSNLLTLKTNTGNGFNQFRSDLVITASYPLLKWDLNQIMLIDGKDTIRPQCRFVDSLKRTIVVLHKWGEDKQYKLFIPDSVFFGINNFTQDSIRIEFKTKAPKEFGNLILAFNPEQEGQYIVQILDEKESTIFEQQIASDSSLLKFNYMTPGKFKIKAILDRNRNRRWDTGSYRNNIQPEEVFYLPKILEIRANWDIEETWSL
jgi:hypothetical protein